MHSYFVLLYTDARSLSEVLILVLMEDALVLLAIFSVISISAQVLILVLMEDALVLIRIGFENPAYLS